MRLPLSAAIILGSTMATPGEHSGANSFPGYCGMVPTRCALELALLAVGRGGDLYWGEAHQVWPWLGTYIEKDSLLARVAHKFDKEYLTKKSMSLEQFADWVASIEPAEAEPNLPCAIAATEESSMGVKSGS